MTFNVDTLFLKIQDTVKEIKHCDLVNLGRILALERMKSQKIKSRSHVVPITIIHIKEHGYSNIKDENAFESVSLFLEKMNLSILSP